MRDGAGARSLAIRFFNPNSSPGGLQPGVGPYRRPAVSSAISPSRRYTLKVLVSSLHDLRYSTLCRIFWTHEPLVPSREVARENFRPGPELFYNLPDHAKNEEMCRRAVGHDGSYLQYVPRSGKRGVVHGGHTAQSLCHRPPAREHEKPGSIHEPGAGEPAKPERRSPRSQDAGAEPEAFERTYGRTKRFLGYQRVERPAWSCRCSASRTTRRRYTG